MGGKDKVAKEKVAKEKVSKDTRKLRNPVDLIRVAMGSKKCVESCRVTMETKRSISIPAAMETSVAMDTLKVPGHFVSGHRRSKSMAKIGECHVLHSFKATTEGLHTCLDTVTVTMNYYRNGSC